MVLKVYPVSGASYDFVRWKKEEVSMSIRRHVRLATLRPRHGSAPTKTLCLLGFPSMYECVF